tara:strand:- start:225 stop:476 length:252 start_codon:yes stop_codon:yes gene_type:complete
VDHVGRQRSKAPRFKKHQLYLSARETVMQYLNVILHTQLCEQPGVGRSIIKRRTKTRNFPEPLPASGREPLFEPKAVQYWPAY